MGDQVASSSSSRNRWRIAGEKVKTALQMAQSSTSTHRRDLFEVAYLGLSLLGSFLILRWAILKMDPNKDARSAAKERSKQLAKRLGRPVKTDGAYEDVIAQEVVNPNMIHITLADVGGLDHIIDDLKRNLITPMRQPAYFKTSLLRQKRGVLLYGPPGTGKTMLAKALAKECGACFINLKSSTVLSKWYGDTNKLINAVWTLARKIQPTILFIDEVDSLLGSRRSMDHEATTSMRTEFMQLWEGFETRPDNNIVVLGATNKKDALDDAVLRRFSLQYEVGLPKLAQRESILRLMMKKHQLEAGNEFVSPMLLETGRVNPLRDIAERTEGYSGSDLDELCSQAAALPVHGLITELEQWEREGRALGRRAPTMQPLSKSHFEEIISRMPPPSRLAQQHQAQQQNRQNRGNGNGGSGRFRRGEQRPEGSLFSMNFVRLLASALASMPEDSYAEFLQESEANRAFIDAAMHPVVEEDEVDDEEGEEEEEHDEDGSSS